MTCTTPSASAILPYQAGSRLSLRIDGFPFTLNVDVLQPVLPFRPVSQILVVQSSSEETEELLDLPRGTSFIVKVYDPRFREDRFKCKWSRPWSYTAECEAAKIRVTEGRDPDFKFWPEPEEEDAAGWEEWFYQKAETQHHYELSAYRRLAPLQGTFVPRCYGTGVLKLPNRHICPDVLLLEYVPDARRLDTVDPQNVDSSIARALLDTVGQIHELGVTHLNFNEGHVLFTPGGCPTRGVIIDFGWSSYRGDLESDVEWKEEVEASGDYEFMKLYLKRFLGSDIESIYKQDTIYSVWEDGKVPFVSAEDIGELAADLLASWEVRQPNWNRDVIIHGLSLNSKDVRPLCLL
ncbi:hypothetical protein AN958_11113 [Leucoagaricus sp. SymC.cos]|nr:hypothetical protein AN958_11113 [Leucoagaricus sp. SymC.cos]